MHLLRRLLRRRAVAGPRSFKDAGTGNHHPPDRVMFERFACHVVVLQRLTSSGPSERIANARKSPRPTWIRDILRYPHGEPLRMRIQTRLNRGVARIAGALP